jgi:hypothetical protein
MEIAPFSNSNQPQNNFLNVIATTHFPKQFFSGYLERKCGVKWYYKGLPNELSLVKQYCRKIKSMTLSPALFVFPYRS